MTEETNALPNGYSLHRYQIEGVLGAGGFGITYRAMHEALENEVAIKEYFPAEWAYRDHNGVTVRANAQGQIPARHGEPPCYEWGLQRFLDEAKILVQVNHPGVVRVRDYFTANGTAYIVMEFEEGESMSTLLQRGGILPEQELHRLLGDVMPALESVHGQGYLHRDLKPSNLYVRSRDSHVMLIDFGAARQALGRRSRSVTSVVTPGYSPIEQYVTVGEDYGPWTDIYALGAVLYRCITGAPPVEAPGRVLKDPVQPAVEAGAGLYSHGLLQVVDQALAVRPEDRFQSVAAMREALKSTGQSDDYADFSQVPPISPELLELSQPIGVPRLGPAPNPASSPSIRLDWPKDDARPGRDQAPPPPFREQPVPSHPSRRGAAPLAAARGNPSGSAAATPSPSLIQAADTDYQSLHLLENIWEQLDEPSLAAGPSTSEARAESSSQSQPDSSRSLLKRAPQSAVEHLKKAGASRRETISGIRSMKMESPPSAPDQTSISRSSQVLPAGTAPALADQPIRDARSINWMHVLLTASAVAGLIGTGLLAYEYYRTSQEQQRQHEAALQQQRQAEEAQHAQETVQQTEAEVTHHIGQARRAITEKNWALANLSLSRAATVNPNHPAVAAVRSELHAAQVSGVQIKTRTDKTTGLELHWVEGGCFDMGSPVAERDRGSDELPHQVCVKGFWIGKTEITNGQYRRFKSGHDSGSVLGRSLNGDTQPAVNLNWEDAEAFAEWLSWEAGTGKRFRLPTEAEWEYAARARAPTRYYWGNDIDPRYANFSDRNDPTGASVGSLDDHQAVTAPVGGYLPNALGLRDVAGNVWEWVCSEYDPNYGGGEQRCSNQRAAEGQRVVRGGSWNNGPGELRSAKRLPRKPGHRDAMTGFRVVMEE